MDYELLVRRVESEPWRELRATRRETPHLRIISYVSHEGGRGGARGIGVW